MPAGGSRSGHRNFTDQGIWSVKDTTKRTKAFLNDHAPLKLPRGIRGWDLALGFSAALGFWRHRGLDLPPEREYHEGPTYRKCDSRECTRKKQPTSKKGELTCLSFKSS